MEPPSFTDPHLALALVWLPAACVTSPTALQWHDTLRKHLSQEWGDRKLWPCLSLPQTAPLSSSIILGGDKNPGASQDWHGS